METPDSPADGWKAHEEEQRRSWLRLTPAERLAWLEGAKEFAREALGAAHRNTGAKTADPRGARKP
jgi:hypothetical protein